ncbi:MAG: transporter substrate-binding domain-containing protein [Clostridia bacterium]|nr:transporter substrate-binding domain-containing protein [Clostridia bacterium]
MKKILALVLAIMFCLSGLAFADEAKPELHMGTNANFPPYEYHEYVDDVDTIVGIDAEIAAAVADYLGYELVIDDMDFGAIITAVQTGKIDFGMAGMTVTEERLESVNFSDTYATGIQAIIVPEGSDITSADDLFVEGKNYIIGVQESTTGDLYCTWDIEDEGLGTVDRYKNGADAVQALVTGKVDCVVIDNEPAKAFVAANEGLTILETAYAVEDYAIAIAKDNTDLLEKINGALAALTEDGTIPAIIEKYIPTEEAAE